MWVSNNSTGRGTLLDMLVVHSATVDLSQHNGRARFHGFSWESCFDVFVRYAMSAKSVAWPLYMAHVFFVYDPEHHRNAYYLAEPTHISSERHAKPH